jgi:ABC-type tungstate transport system substrate-binding protein
MEAPFIYVILTCFAVGFISNFLTLLYIVNSFNIRTHVFLLIFIDTLFSTSCCFVGVILYVFIAAEVIEINFIFCTLSFFVSYIPTNLGSFTTFLTSAVRYYLTIKSAKNIQPSKSKVSRICFFFVVLDMMAAMAWLAINLVLQTPSSATVQLCTNRY